MSLESVPLIELTQTELNIAAAQLDHPTVKKYLTSVIRPLIAEVIIDGDIPAEGSSETLDRFQIRVARMRGKIEALEELLRVESAKPDSE